MKKLIKIEKKLGIDLEELADFLVNAKREGYANNSKYTSLPDGSKKFKCSFKYFNFTYEDTYAGESQFQGIEKVANKKDNKVIWQMGYSGGMFLDYINNKKLTKNTFQFLRNVLLNVTNSFPFRGPKGNFKDKEKFNGFEYINITSLERDNLRRFKGTENIKKDGKLVYSLDYAGGLTIPK